jgi:hypothetical protein
VNIIILLYFQLNAFLAGQEKYEAITTPYLRNSDCVILVYDITDRYSFDKVQHYASLFEEHQVSKKVIFKTYISRREAAIIIGYLS